MLSYSFSCLVTEKVEENGGNLVFWEVGFSTAAISFSGSVFSGLSFFRMPFSASNVTEVFQKQVLRTCNYLDRKNSSV